MALCALPRPQPRPRELPGTARAALGRSAHSTASCMPRCILPDVHHGAEHYRHTAVLSHCERGTLILTTRLPLLPLVVAAGRQNTRPNSPANMASNLHSSARAILHIYTADSN